MIKENIESVIVKRKSFSSHAEFSPNHPDLSFQGNIPTLEKGVYREASPMLMERFKYYGRWESATHGNWLSISDMQEIWSDDIQDDFIDLVKFQADCLKTDWPNHAFGLFKDNRLSLFSGSDVGNESIFLLWLDDEVEPELWVYDSNGESRYKNLNEYLLAYLQDDLSASTRSWRA
ncbi:Uncharacterised protein [Serratia rubidaea]|uniref:SMI1 / KNR4 family n=1 Tax=Serratia rubidaea TaxID=61652 RepID=A0A4U9HU37_SERRU|nr:hypothetical protein [Serratia rubidaea]MDC6109163.1 hypothetical protein [Serratia rubidaea]MDK1706675.1 hypothetical protein [Serratia rubidaea]CAI1180296.1 Uncharacterised protein [Serratia rubidaea]CAI1989857.1 Uncharacterised protein [Serratia rubidaea]VTP67415.1 Uncharacterised protein [Serratia rubidaea]